MKPRILVADDDSQVRRALGNSLTRAGFDVTLVDDGAPAIAMSTTHAFDIVIADLNMTTIGGVEVVRHYKDRYGTGVCCVVLSGEDNEGTRASCYAAGADDVIAKPTTPSDLRVRFMAAMLALHVRAA